MKIAMLEDDEDAIGARRAWQALLADADAQIATEQTDEYRTERRLELTNRRRWRDLPPTRLARGVQTERLTDAELALLDREGL